MLFDEFVEFPLRQSKKIEALGDDGSSVSLNYILRGQVDVKATTLKKIASALRGDCAELLKF